MTTSLSPDRQLLAEHLAGVAGAFDELFRRHRDRLWAVAVRTLGDPADAEDAVQEAFLAALRSDTYRGDAEVGTWLHRIVLNKCLDRLRRRRPGDPGVRSPDPPGPDPSAEVPTRLAVDDALARLPAEQRAAVVLVDVHGCPVAEVARMLAVPVGTVKSRCSRGRLRLATLLGHLREEP